MVSAPNHMEEFKNIAEELNEEWDYDGWKYAYHIIEEDVNEVQIPINAEATEIEVRVLRETATDKDAAATNVYVQNINSNGPVFIGGTSAYQTFAEKRYLRSSAKILRYPAPQIDDDGDIHYGVVDYITDVCSFKSGYNDNMFTYTDIRQTKGETAYPDDILDTVIVASSGDTFSIGTKISVYYR